MDKSAMENSLQGQFLVSMPALHGDYFQESVTFLIEHNADGAFGLVINQPLEVQLEDFFPELEDVDHGICVLGGGPVEQDRIFFLHSPDKQYEGSQTIHPQVVLSTSTELIGDLAKGRQPKSLLACIGYAGWGPEQLESEIMNDVWLLTPFSNQILYSRDYKTKPQAAAKAMGIDLNLIGSTSGHG
ncbi:MAG: YqgE/AlgH family protein [Pseudomonadales bacterium]